VSLNIIPYAGMVNPGAHMFDFIGGVRINGMMPGPDRIPGTADDIPYPQVSSCVEIEAADFTHPRLPGTGREQVPHFMTWDAAGVVTWGWCPQERTSIAYALSSPAQAESYIRNMQMHDGTGTHVGMKWGLALLDPTSQPAFQHLSNAPRNIIPPQFANRPAAWSDTETKKIIVLMTDGAITEQFRPTDRFDPRNLTSPIGTVTTGSNPRTRMRSSVAENVASFLAMCDMAKHPSRNIQVYTVAFEVSGAGETQMRQCASNPSMFFKTGGAGLVEVFSGIAERITDLRLNL
jgi:hypothetical protein